MRLALAKHIIGSNEQKDAGSLPDTVIISRPFKKQSKLTRLLPLAKKYWLAILLFTILVLIFVVWLMVGGSKEGPVTMDPSDKSPAPAASPDALNPPTQEQIAQSETARASQASIYLANNNPQGVIDMYQSLLNQTSDVARQAQLLTEQSSILWPDYLQQYKTYILDSATKADALAPSAASARLVYDIAQDAGDQALADQYKQLYETRVDKNARPE